MKTIDIAKKKSKSKITSGKDTKVKKKSKVKIIVKESK